MRINVGKEMRERKDIEVASVVERSVEGNVEGERRGQQKGTS